MRIGSPRMLNDGSFYDSESWLDVRKRKDEDLPPNAHAFVTGCNIEIRSYNLKTASEVKAETLISRTKTIHSSPAPYDTSIDLIAGDLRDIPRVLADINQGIAQSSI